MLVHVHVHVTYVHVGTHLLERESTPYTCIVHKAIYVYLSISACYVQEPLTQFLHVSAWAVSKGFSVQCESDAMQFI